MTMQRWAKRIAQTTSLALLLSALPVLPLALAGDDTPGTVPDGGVLLASAEAAETGGFGEFARYVGQLGYSADGLGQSGGGGSVTAELPAGATVRQAFLYGSYFSTTSPSAAQRMIRFGGQDVLLETIPSGAGSFLSAARAEVTAHVAAAYGGGSGRRDFVVANDPVGLDGVALLVIYEDRSLPVSTIAVVDGGAAQGGQRTVLRFSAPIDKDSPSFRARMSLGIGYGFQSAEGSVCGSVAQSSLVAVNGLPLSGCAGGYDDGIGANGGLITVGGVGDTLDNPSDPRQAAGDGRQPRVVDDELYDLGRFVEDGDSQLVVETANPSFDDILFLTVINVSARIASVTSVPVEQSYGSGSGTHATNPTGFLSDPVNTLTGSFVTGAVDLLDSTPLGGLQLERFYNSVDDRVGPLGRGWAHTLGVRLLPEGDGAVVLLAEDGQRVRYEADGGGSLVPPPGARSVLRRDGADYELVRADGARYGFDERGLLTELRGPLGGRVAVTHDSAGRLVGAVDQAGRSLSFVTDAAGRITAVTSSDGRTVRYGYDGDLLTSVTDVRGGVVRYAHDAAGRITEVVDQNGHVDVRNDYDAQGRVVAQTDGLGARSTFTWDDAAQSVTMTDALGRQYVDRYADGVLVERVDGLGRQQLFERDEELRITAFSDASGRYDISYDTRGAVRRIVAADGRAVEARNDEAGRPTLVEDPSSGVVQLAYDALGSLSSATGPQGSATFEHGEDRLLDAVTDGAGGSLSLERDAAGSPTAVPSAQGRQTRFGYGPGGLVTTVVAPHGGPTTQDPLHASTVERDAAGNAVALVDPLGNRVQQVFDAVGNLVAATDGIGTTRYAYDAADRLVQVQSADGSTTRYEHDAVGNVVRRIDAAGGVTRYDVDGADRLVAQTSPTGQRWTYTWDADDDLLRVDRPGGSTSYTYDASRRLLAVDHSDDTPDVRYTYDERGRRTSMTDGSGRVDYEYDAAGQLAAVVRDGRAIRYGYDAVGRVTSRSYPGGRTVTYTWTADGDLASVQDGPRTTRYEHDAAGRLVRVEHPNGTVETRAHDRAGRVVETLVLRNGGIASGERLELDSNGNPLTISDITAGGSVSRVRSFRYDAEDRLVAECASASCRPGRGQAVVEYEYDALGNRVLERRPGRTVQHRYDAANQLVSSTDGRTTTAYEHDAAGNLVRAGSTRYRYDLENRLVEVRDTRTGTRTGYERDGEGNVVRRTGAHAAELLWDPNAAVPLLVREDGQDRRADYTWAHALLAVTEDGASPVHVHTDRLGSVVSATGASGQPLLQREYAAFGSVTRTSGPAAGRVPFGFAGHYADPAGALVDMKARAYDPTTGRFLQRDALATPLLDPYASAYAYVGNRPTVVTDPTGLFCVFGKNSGGSCRGSGVARAVGNAVSATADFVVENRYKIGGVAVGAACIGAGVFTAGAATIACYAGAAGLLAGQVGEAFVKAQQGPGFAVGQFFADAGTAAFLTWATMIPGLGISAQALKGIGLTALQRGFVSANATFPALLCTFYCPPIMVEQRRRSIYGVEGRK